mgnify:CR=1 FL=1|tara:strand:- start:4092 stop:4793 length:702 start_codon:yes stop_codon:yes gene_type:complete
MPFLKQVVILAGGKGTRMREMTTDLPKPMVSIGDKPVIDHLIEIFEYFGNFEFVIPTGYLGNIIEEHFKNKKNVRVVETGLDTNTGGRIKKIEDILEERFLVTYGDGLANVNINKLIDFHKKNNGIGTMTVTNPVSRFGLVNFNKESRVESFIEKPKLDGFVNIGFMIFEKNFLKYLNYESTLESKPLAELSKDGELYAFKHFGFFEPMDTYREYLNMNKLYNSGNMPWKNFN